MGTYEFTCATTGEISDVEYTFGYKRNSDGKVRICLHHSSIPYEPGNLKEAKGVFRMKQTTIIDPAQLIQKQMRDIALLIGYKFKKRW